MFKKLRRKFGYTQRICVACSRPYWQKGSGLVAKKAHLCPRQEAHGPECDLLEQFCSRWCKDSFFHGYDLGMRVMGDIRRRRG